MLVLVKDLVVTRQYLQITNILNNTNRSRFIEVIHIFVCSDSQADWY